MLFTFERRLLMLLCGLIVAAAVFMAAAPLWRNHRALFACRAAVKTLGASSTAFAPSGSPSRLAGGGHPAVDLRHVPSLSRSDP
jgi:hypothetical protein